MVNTDDGVEHSVAFMRQVSAFADDELDRLEALIRGERNRRAFLEQRRVAIAQISEIANKAGFAVEETGESLTIRFPEVGEGGVTALETGFETLGDAKTALPDALREPGLLEGDGPSHADAEALEADRVVDTEGLPDGGAGGDATRGTGTPPPPGQGGAVGAAPTENPDRLAGAKERGGLLRTDETPANPAVHRKPKVVYRNPENPKYTWDGNPPRPRWVTVCLGNGATLESLLAVPKQATPENPVTAGP